MTDPFYTPGRATPARKPTPGAHQWTMRRGTEWTDCEFRIHGEWGVEVQLLRNGSFFHGSMYLLTAQAQRAADEYRQHLEGEGWRVTEP